ncbi:hypothetical protein A2116_01385 [Candidatus Jorgensenbacteria bacterium GWA1_49_17]|uniref:Uncharacterized protein n=1 Tax=Candidatus Jorgensenbacteria bacterium GWA1_49_17 TaxID=1798467 RepID=A0A1F6BU08_9BACT|nr:MAG: hypothetical protein A2116_01385 [Candidatus Jorgensenbacteria bacterium GWA1_49_17]
MPTYPSVPSTLKYTAEEVAFRIMKSRAEADGAPTKTPAKIRKKTTILVFHNLRFDIGFEFVIIKVSRTERVPW